MCYYLLMLGGIQYTSLITVHPCGMLSSFRLAIISLPFNIFLSYRLKKCLMTTGQADTYFYIKKTKVWLLTFNNDHHHQNLIPAIEGWLCKFYFFPIPNWGYVLCHFIGHNLTGNFRLLHASPSFPSSLHTSTPHTHAYPSQTAFLNFLFE